MGRNTKTEQKAIKLVIDYESKNYKNNPRDCHNERKGYDIECSNKIIEVKSSTENKIPFFELNNSNLKALNDDKEYFVYVVYDLNNKPKLLKINKKIIQETKKRKIKWEIPLNKNRYQEVIEL